MISEYHDDLEQELNSKYDRAKGPVEQVEASLIIDALVEANIVLSPPQLNHLFDQISSESDRNFIRWKLIKEQFYDASLVKTTGTK